MLQQLTQSFAQSFAQASYDYSYQSSSGAGGPPTSVWVVYGIFLILMLVSMWKVFTKAGRPGWAAIVPFYNSWVMLEMGGQPGWWIFVAFIPLVGLWTIVIGVKALIEISKRFGKSGAFALLLIFLPFIGYPILAFGKATYDASRGSVPNNPAAGGTPPAPGYPQPPVAPSNNQVAQAGQPQSIGQAPQTPQVPQTSQPTQPSQYGQPVQPPQPPTSNLVQ